MSPIGGAAVTPRRIGASGRTNPGAESRPSQVGLIPVWRYGIAEVAQLADAWSLSLQA